MANFIRPMFKEVKSVIAERFCSTTANAIDSTSVVPNGYPVTLHCSTGNVFIMPNSTVIGSAIKMYEGMMLDIGNASYISITSDSTTAKFQAIVWKD